LNHLLAMQYSDLSLWEQQNVSAEHPRNRPPMLPNSARLIRG
jgi:hypothetical protein